MDPKNATDTSGAAGSADKKGGAGAAAIGVARSIRAVSGLSAPGETTPALRGALPERSSRGRSGATRFMPPGLAGVSGRTMAPPTGEDAGTLAVSAMPVSTGAPDRSALSRAFGAGTFPVALASPGAAA
jgi:hypothetical protein